MGELVEEWRIVIVRLVDEIEDVDDRFKMGSFLRRLSQDKPTIAQENLPPPGLNGVCIQLQRINEGEIWKKTL